METKDAVNEILENCERVRSWLNHEGKEVMTRTDAEDVLFKAIFQIRKHFKGE